MIIFYTDPHYIIIQTAIESVGHSVKNDLFFDTIKFDPRGGPSAVKARAEELEINLRYYPDGQVILLTCLMLVVKEIFLWYYPDGRVIMLTCLMLLSEEIILSYYLDGKVITVTHPICMLKFFFSKLPFNY